jgi:hypothetical protein
MTCALIPQSFTDIDVTPTVTFSKGTLSVNAGTKGLARMWNIIGQLVNENKIEEGYTEITAPAIAGTYILEIILEDGTKKTYKITVRSNM